MFRLYYSAGPLHPCYDYLPPRLLVGSSVGDGENPVAKFLVHDWGDVVDPGIRLSYRPARLHTVGWLAGTTTLSQGLRIWTLSLYNQSNNITQR